MSPTPWEQASAQRKSLRQEQRLAKLPGGAKQINSGRHPHSKRDVRLNGYLIEARTTDSDSYAIKRAEFQQLELDAVRTPPGLLPMMGLCINGLNVVVIREQDHLYREEYIGILHGKITELQEELQSAEDADRDEDS